MAKFRLKDNEKVKDEIIGQLLLDIPSMEVKVFDQIMAFIDQFSRSGDVFSDTMTAEKLIQLEGGIKSILISNGYFQKVEVFIKDFEKITTNTNAILNDNGFGSQVIQLSDIERKWQGLTVETLVNSGIRDDFQRPILQIVDDAITYGKGISTTRETLRQFVLGGNDTSGKLKSYLTQTARDSMNQMQGQQVQSVANVVGYVGVRYTGGTLVDSRGQCTRWIEDLNGFIPKEKIAEEIKLAYKNQRLKKVDGTHKWGGMMPNTTPDNFMVKRGGFNCTHSAFPTRKK